MYNLKQLPVIRESVRCTVLALFFAIFLCACVSCAFAAPGPQKAAITTSKSRTASSSFQIRTTQKFIRAEDQIEISVGGYAFSISGSSFKFDKRTKRFTFTALKNSLGVSSVVLDAKAKLFKFSVLGVPLIDENFPLVVDVAIGERRRCVLFGSGKQKAGVLRLSDMGKCPGPKEGLTADRAVIPFGEQSEVTFALRTTEPVAQTSLHEADLSGKIGAKICDLLDGGESDHGDTLAGDQIYSCKTRMNLSALGRHYFMAKGKRRGSIAFPGISLTALGPIGAPELSAALSGQSAALDMWKSYQSGADGFDDSQKIELIQQILALPGVSGAAFSPNGIDIVITMASGLKTVLVLNSRTQPIDSTVVRSMLEKASNVHSAPQHDIAVSASSPLKVFLFDPGYFPSAEDATIKKVAEAAEPGQISLTLVDGQAAAEVSSLNAMPGHDLIILTTHGSVDTNGRVGFVVPLLDESKLYNSYLPLLQSGQIVLAAVANIGPGFVHTSVLVMPEYFSALPASFNGATVIGSSCFSAANATMANAFLSKGASGYVGFDEAVSVQFAEKSVVEFLCATLFDDKSIGAAYDSLTPKIDNVPLLVDGKPAPPAEVKFAGDPSALLGGDISFRNLTPEINPLRSVLFFGETADISLGTGGSIMPSCMKFRIRNSSSNMLSVARKTSDGQYSPVGEETFSERNLRLAAGDTKGVADLTVYVVEDDGEKVIGQNLPEVEVLCGRPDPISLVASSSTVNVGDEVVINSGEISTPGCDLSLAFTVSKFNSSGAPSGDSADCGRPLNTEVGSELWDDRFVSVIPFSALPLRLATSTAHCPNTTKLIVNYEPIARTTLSSFLASGRAINPGVRTIEISLNADLDNQSGYFETRYVQYTRVIGGITYDYYYVITIPFISPPSAGRSGRYCLQVDTRGVPGPDGQELQVPYPPPAEYFVVSEDPCLSLAQFPNFSNPTEEECGDWLGGAMGLADFGSPPDFGLGSSLKFPVGRGVPCDPLTQTCSIEQALEYFAPLRQWTFTARRLTGNETNCSQ